MMQEFSVRQGLQAGGIIRCTIPNTGNVIMQCDVTMKPLMKGLETQEMCGWFCCGCGTFALPVQST